jgi:hypothetical protein
MLYLQTITQKPLTINQNYMSFLFLDYNDLLVILTPILVVFGILLFLGIRKSYKLKKENEKLAELSEELTHEDDDTYEDFTDGHMYQ